jgi:hypothetical protein
MDVGRVIYNEKVFHLCSELKITSPSNHTLIYSHSVLFGIEKVHDLYVFVE